MNQLELPLATPSHPIDPEEEKLVQQALAAVGCPERLIGYSVEKNTYVRNEFSFVDGFGPDVF